MNPYKEPEQALFFGSKAISSKNFGRSGEAKPSVVHFGMQRSGTE
ncbi:hypothetical protein P872_20625 [Rhodonellum psychrophilum GCM71 = DSM 17998]|uniref:Uncharacterized protein n=1 Tax=Rhodonellum psychrophilum GCM71 = DSM 17998 TaxID=1123057 RepID=U5BT97_9BACT|nr:hypothetical protein P872_20625 [Rhodonellum psychrophilum GCM71 = DSM 17998]